MESNRKYLDALLEEMDTDKKIQKANKQVDEKLLLVRIMSQSERFLYLMENAGIEGGVMVPLTFHIFFKEAYPDGDIFGWMTKMNEEVGGKYNTAEIVTAIRKTVALMREIYHYIKQIDGPDDEVEMTIKVFERGLALAEMESERHQIQ